MPPQQKIEFIDALLKLLDFVYSPDKELSMMKALASKLHHSEIEMQKELLDNNVVSPDASDPEPEQEPELEFTSGAGDILAIESIDLIPVLGDV